MIGRLPAGAASEAALQKREEVEKGSWGDNWSRERAHSGLSLPGLLKVI
jgi:hypothetical protein